MHGLGRTPLSTLGLARHLRRAGHTTETFGYAGAFESFDRIGSRLAVRLDAIVASGQPYAVIGHSLGGLLLRHALAGVSRQPSHFVMLATPNQLPRLARRVRRFWPWRLATGQPGQILCDEAFFARLPRPAAPYTIVAGTAGSRGRWSPFGGEPNDWLVSVSETVVGPGDQPVLLPVGHTFMMANARVRDVVAGAIGA